MVRDTQAPLRSYRRRIGRVLTPTSMAGRRGLIRSRAGAQPAFPIEGDPVTTPDRVTRREAGVGGGDPANDGDVLGGEAEPDVADGLGGVPYGRMTRVDGLETRRDVTALRGDVVRMDPQEDERISGPGQVG